MSRKEIRINSDELKENGIDRVGELNPYITLLCDLRCRYCYMFDYLSKDKLDIMTEGFYYALLDHFIKDGNGLDRHTFLGGEPTMHPSITAFATHTAEQKINERRMTTNGISLHELDLSQLPINAFDHVSVSIDGHTGEINDATRGRKTFEKILETIRKYKEAGVKVSVNYTVTSKNIEAVQSAPAFFHQLGVSILNFHVVSNIGNALNNASMQLNVDPEMWIKQRDKLLETTNLPGLTLRIPYMFLTSEEVYSLDYRPIQEQNYHSPNGGYRLIVFPPTPKGQGLCYMSADLIGIEGAHVATIDSQGIFHWNHDPRNEWLAYQKSNSSDVSSELRGEKIAKEKNLTPTSISFKKTIHL